MDDYREVYRLLRKELLSRQPSQLTVDYEYIVYTIWDISVASIKEVVKEISSATAANALDLVKLFNFFHFDNIFEDIFKLVFCMASRSQGSKRVPSDRL